MEREQIIKEIKPLLMLMLILLPMVSIVLIIFKDNLECDADLANIVAFVCLYTAICAFRELKRLC